MIVTKLWFYLALGAAVLWGLGYAMTEKLLEMKMTPSFLLFLTGLVTFPAYAAFAFISGDMKAGFELFKSNPKILIFTTTAALCYVIANFFILYSIVGKNATIASMIEITYPIFTVFFVWLLMGKMDLNPYTLLGGALILGGVFIMYFKG